MEPLLFSRLSTEGNLAHLVSRVVFVRDPRPFGHALPPVLEGEQLGELLSAAAAEPALRPRPPDAVRPRPQVHLQPLAHPRRDGVLGAPRAAEAVAVHPAKVVTLRCGLPISQDKHGFTPLSLKVIFAG